MKIPKCMELSKKPGPKASLVDYFEPMTSISPKCLAVANQTPTAMSAK